MSSETLTSSFAERVDDIAKRADELERDQELLLGEIGERVVDRLLELFRQDGSDSEDFGVWVNGRFVNSTAPQVHAVFIGDEELMSLLGLVRRSGRTKIYLVARGIKRRLGEIGYSLGVNSHLNHILRL